MEDLKTLKSNIDAWIKSMNSDISNIDESVKLLKSNINTNNDFIYFLASKLNEVIKSQVVLMLVIATLVKELKKNAQRKN